MKKTKKLLVLMLATLMASALVACNEAPTARVIYTTPEPIQAPTIVDKVDEATRTPSPELASESDFNQYQPFYGIWMGASEDLDTATKNVDRLREQGVDAFCFLSSEWSNLNPKPYYVWTAGIYYSEEDAKVALPAAQKIRSNAYVKYSGEYIG